MIRPHCSQSARRTGGFTLLEIVVVLLLLGIASALVVPFVGSPAAASDTSVERLIEQARRAAIERAEPLTLSIAPDGQWLLEARSGPARRGTVQWLDASFIRLRISSLGACTAESAVPALRIDPVRCRLLE